MCYVQADDLQRAGARYARSVSKAGYDAEHKSWEDFTYTAPSERREAVRKRADALGTLPPLQIMLVGGPATGKGTIGPMLVQAFRCRQIGVGQLLRSLSRTGADVARGEQIQEAMSRGELLDDEFVIGVLSERLEGSWDVRRNGWLLDGFPKSAAQAKASLEQTALRPDCVIALERPTELMKEFILGRMTDSATGHVYHPRYHPVIDESISERLTWRIDDTKDVAEKRIVNHEREGEAILKAFDDAGVPTLRVNNARSEIATFDEIADFVEHVARDKLGRMGGAQSLARANEEFDEDEPADAENEDTSNGLLTAVRKLNTYDPSDYFPVLVGEAQVGFVSNKFLTALAPYFGASCEIVPLETDKATKEDGASGAMAEGAARKATVGVRLAPDDSSVSTRTETVAALVRELVLDGAIPKGKLRNELQDVRYLSDGWVGPGGPDPPLRLERGAMVHFGVPSYGVHVNGYVRNPDQPDDPRPWAVWVAKRSMSKATYPGKLDQMVAGGQPSEISFLENVQKECEEEASLPPEVIDRIRSAGLVRYRYAARKGLSTKILATFDVEMPNGLIPVCGDGEVEGFELMKVDDLIESVRSHLDAWKPNSALVMIEFMMRHGFLQVDEPGYVEIATLCAATDRTRRSDCGFPPMRPQLMNLLFSLVCASQTPRWSSRLTTMHDLDTGHCPDAYTRRNELNSHAHGSRTMVGNGRVDTGVV